MQTTKQAHCDDSAGPLHTAEPPVEVRSAHGLTRNVRTTPTRAPSPAPMMSKPRSAGWPAMVRSNTRAPGAAAW